MDSTAPATDSANLNTPVIPGYALGELLGRGGMGRVYKARDLKLKRIVAVKLLAGAADAEALARFDAEGKAVATLHHRHIAQIYETGAVDGQPYYAMEFVAGGTLGQFLVGQPLAPRTAAELMLAIARGMQHAHAAGIVHRDLKPGNILLESDSGPLPAGDRSPPIVANLLPKIVDFGIAKRLNETALTQTGQILGTPSYMPPEQASGVVKGVGPTADVYAIGAILYECLTGRPPFVGSEPLQIVMMVLTQEPVTPRRLQPKVSADLETICLRCLHKQPRRRYATAGELADDLQRFLDGKPIVARPITVWERGWKWAHRKPWQALAAGMALAALVGAALGVYLLQASYRATKAANERLTAQKREADELLALTLANLDTFTFQFSDRLYELPQGEKLRRDVLDRARESLAGLDRLRPTDPKVRTYQVEAYDKLANAEVRMSRLEPALAAQERAYQLAVELADEFPTDVDQRRRRAVMPSRLAILNQRLGNTAASETFWRETESQVERLLVDFPGIAAIAHLRTVVLIHRAQHALMAGRKQEAEEALREYVTVYRQVARLEPDNSERQLERADAELQLAGFLMTNGAVDEGLGLVGEAEKAVAAQPMPRTQLARRTTANVLWTRGDLLAQRGDTPKAVEAYRAALAEFTTLSDDFPKSWTHRHHMALMHWSIGKTWLKAGEASKGRAELLSAKAILEQHEREVGSDEGDRQLLAWVNETLGPEKPK